MKWLGAALLQIRSHMMYLQKIHARPILRLYLIRVMVVGQPALVAVTAQRKRKDHCHQRHLHMFAQLASKFYACRAFLLGQGTAVIVPHMSSEMPCPLLQMSPKPIHLLLLLYRVLHTYHMCTNPEDTA